MFYLFFLCSKPTFSYLLPIVFFRFGGPSVAQLERLSMMLKLSCSSIDTQDIQMLSLSFPVPPVLALSALTLCNFFSMAWLLVLHRFRQCSDI